MLNIVFGLNSLTNVSLLSLKTKFANLVPVKEGKSNGFSVLYVLKVKLRFSTYIV